MVSGLNLLTNEFDSSGGHSVPMPEGAWLLHRLLEYAYSAPQPTARMHLRVTKCPGCDPDTNVNICPA